MIKKRYKILFTYFNKQDNAAIGQVFNGKNCSLHTADTEDEALEECMKELPSIIVVNISEDPEMGQYTIRALCDICIERLPYFIICHLTDVTDLIDDPYLEDVLRLGSVLSRYGAEHTVNDVIEHIDFLLDFTN